MTKIDLLKGALQRIPARYRMFMLYGFALAVVGVELAGIVGLELDYATINEVLLYVGGYLGVQSAANVLPDVDLSRGDDADHRGDSGIAEV